ncbi:RNA ligase family protein [Nostoc sp.]|uniref:RNA ligase family protein n=1 Tax=Nostoc sp. TaxID=1180 RepID=UPI002FF91F79
MVSPLINQGDRPNYQTSQDDQKPTNIGYWIDTGGVGVKPDAIYIFVIIYNTNDLQFFHPMARVQLVYPKIPDSKNCLWEHCIAFEKYDGTNLHWVWESELGWYAFGTRRDRFDLDDMGIAQFNKAHPGLEEAPEIFNRDFAASLERVFQEKFNCQYPEITVFTEFLGTNSFAGMHRRDDPKQLILFDVQIDKYIITPEQFIQYFSQLHIPRVVYRGKITGQFIDDIREGKYGVAEGVICKGGGSNGNNGWMVKIKTYAYMNKLQQAFKDDWKTYWE